MISFFFFFGSVCHSLGAVVLKPGLHRAWCVSVRPDRLDSIQVNASIYTGYGCGSDRAGGSGHPPKKYPSLLCWTDLQTSTMHRVLDRKLGVKRKLKIWEFVKIKGPVFRAIVFNKS